MLIDYGDLGRSRKDWGTRYEVTEEFSVHNGRFGTREDVVFLTNGIPVLVIECKNANKEEAIALGGDLGNYLMAGLPNASYLGFTGTPIDQTAYGRGTFKTFGCEDDKGYLHKYSIAESIEDGTTLPLYYNLAPNDMLVPHDVMEREFLSLVETEGIADIEELNKILDRAVNLKNFLKHRSERDLRGLRKQVTFAIVAHEDDLNKVAAIVDDLFTILRKRGTA